MMRLGPLALACALLACLACLACSGEPATPIAEPERPASAIRNVLIVSLDTLGAKHVGAYGYSKPTTPRLDVLAAEGTLFEAAYTPQVYTLTAHISMMSGLQPQTHGATPKKKARSGATQLAEILKRNGFATGGFTGAAGYMRPGFGLGRGFDLYQTRASTAEGGKLMRDWIEKQMDARKADPEHRFFLFAHYYDIHSDTGTKVPYAAPPRFQKLFLPDSKPWKHRGDTDLLLEFQAQGLTDRDRRLVNAFYDSGVLFTDQKRLSPLLNYLGRLGVLDETLVIVTSDHGEEIFEHGKCSHQQPYGEVAHVPLVFWGPGIPAGLRIPHLVELADLMPTVLDLLDLPIPKHVQGRSLVPLMRGEGPLRNAVFVDGLTTDLMSRFESAVIFDTPESRWSYVNQIEPALPGQPPAFKAVGTARLYDLRADPLQHEDVSAQHPDLVAQAEAQLIEWYLENERVGATLGDTSPARDLSAPEKHMLRALGYAQ